MLLILLGLSLELPLEDDEASLLEGVYVVGEGGRVDWTMGIKSS